MRVHDFLTPVQPTRIRKPLKRACVSVRQPCRYFVSPTDDIDLVVQGVRDWGYKPVLEEEQGRDKQR
jgi:hypothetical protein